ncbi:hypothetical protein KM043_018708 [Ampulex compressa]|nr:hypothetical protein KM043_018708 [Ampulex compressa]
MSKAGRESVLRRSFIGYEDEYEDSFSEFEDNDDEAPQKDVPPWDMFKCFPPTSKTGSMQENRCLSIIVRILKVFVYIFLLIVVLVSGVIAKSAMLLAVSQFPEERTIRYCDNEWELGGLDFLARPSQNYRIIWMWCIVFIFIVPECFGVLHSIQHYLFKKKPKYPKKRNIFIMFTTETLHAIGLALLVFVVLPDRGAIQSAALFGCLCFIPGLLKLLSRNQEYESVSRRKFLLFLLFDVLSLMAQASGTFVWPFLDHDVQQATTWICPAALILCSCRWWTNYVSHHSRIGFIRSLAKIREDLLPSRHILQGWIAFWRSLVFFASILTILNLKGIKPSTFFNTLATARYVVQLIPNGNFSFNPSFVPPLSYFSAIVRDENQVSLRITDISVPINSFLAQAICAIVVYQLGKFAYKTHMHKIGFAVPINLVTLGTIIVIIGSCTARSYNTCFFRNILPGYLFFDDPFYTNPRDFFTHWHVWYWLVWPLSQGWITMHIWSSKFERLALVEKIFCIPTYDSLMIDQSTVLNRRIHDTDATENCTSDNEMGLQIGPMKSIGKTPDMNDPVFRHGLQDETAVTSVKRNDTITRIYACATMWHEEKEEMNQLVGSILRLDKDQCAMRVTQKYYKIHIEEYYELETHIFFDDAFRCMHGCKGSCNHDENETQVNQYVMTLVETVQKNVEDLCMRSSPPTKYPTPYGGRLMWILPGKTRLIVHLKDKNKIRHRKRWSQVMYMYYLLGYRLMGLPIDVDRKEAIAENTYILTLDGDIDFKPSAVKVLVDLMKKDKELGAACGRIHPVGTGPIVWFQKFEYAIGHWLQKSTEHTIGCVLCSPGCFSLFRAKALMQDNVMAKYASKSTEPRHYVQYDQGEDRWLCTLILQVGCRVEYSAASDAYTHAPEAFKDFYIQRRRWIPSTVANIFDLLNTAQETRRLNDNISWLYIVYQWILMGSTILGPGTIFLMLVGAFVAAFHIDNWSSFWYNLIPILVFVGICLTCKERIQLLMAEIISVIYGLVMIIVLVGIMLQIAQDGWLAPSTLLFFIVAGQLIAAGLMHPQEWACLFCGVIYYITVPSMYMLLIIFSIFNVHNVTWGTRESKSSTVETTKQVTSNERSNGVTRIQKTDGKSKKGQFEFSLAGLFSCAFCTYGQSSKEEIYLDNICESINSINVRLGQLDRMEDMQRINLSKINKPVEAYDEVDGIENHEDFTHEDICQTHDYKATDSESDILTQISGASSCEHSSFLISPYWLQDERMRKGEVDFLPNAEEEFWKDLIGKYLYPIDNDEEKQNKIAKELASMRDEYLLKFFMINALFVLIVFLMQLNKDTLHLQWPLGVKYNITYNEKRNEVNLYKSYLRLEPIGCLFILGFVTILLIQFMAMLVHRFDTFSHMLANATLQSRCCRKKKYSEDGMFEKHADDIARGLQQAVEDEIVFGQRHVSIIPGKRKTIRELTENAQQPSKTLGNFEKLFRRKLDEPNETGLSRIVSSQIPKRALTAFENRRSVIMAERKSQFVRPTNFDVYDSPDRLRNMPDNNNSNVRQLSPRYCGYDNPTFCRGDEL